MKKTVSRKCPDGFYVGTIEVAMNHRTVTRTKYKHETDFTDKVSNTYHLVTGKVEGEKDIVVEVMEGLGDLVDTVQRVEGKVMDRLNKKGATPNIMSVKQKLNALGYSGS